MTQNCGRSTLLSLCQLDRNKRVRKMNYVSDDLATAWVETARDAWVSTPITCENSTD